MPPPASTAPCCTKCTDAENSGGMMLTTVNVACGATETESVLVCFPAGPAATSTMHRCEPSSARSVLLSTRRSLDTRCPGVLIIVICNIMTYNNKDASQEERKAGKHRVYAALRRANGSGSLPAPRCPRHSQ